MKLYNTMSRTKEEFKARDKNKVKIFTCGPSVYRRPHIGNYRTFLYEDLVVRYLEYKGYRVNRVINYTDVEDKTIEEANENNLTPEQLTAKVKRTFLEETGLLNIKLPENIPSSATSVNEAGELIKMLMDKGYAYKYGDNIFFDPLKKKDFGKLAKVDMSRWPKNKVRFKKDTYPGTRWNLGDFILWHGASEGDGTSWDSAVGRGRPSWNIQDPAMIYQNLGFQVDINCGGIDNLARHHDYNIAIMEALSGKEYASYYMHGEHLLVDGKKMSKSAGNIFYPEDLIKDDRDARHLRFFLIHKHYRKSLNFTHKAFHKVSDELDETQREIGNLLTLDENPAPKTFDLPGKVIYAFETAMDDDLYVGAFFREFSSLIKRAVKKYPGLTPAQKKELKDAISKVNDVLHIFK